MGTTPGPWIIEGQTDPFAYITASGMVVARCGSRDEGSPGEHASNAHLIASAPDLYAACEAFEKSWRDSGGVGGDVRELIAAALTKARGGSK